MSLPSRVGNIRALLPNKLVYIIPRCSTHILGLRKALMFSPGVQQGCEGRMCCLEVTLMFPHLPRSCLDLICCF